MRALGTASMPESIAVSIDEVGRVVGFQRQFSLGAVEPLVWSFGSSPALLDSQGSKAGWARGITAAGLAVGMVRDAFDLEHAILWREQRGRFAAHDLKSPLGGLNANAMAVNHQGLWVGSAATADGDTHAFLMRAPVRGNTSVGRLVDLVISPAGAPRRAKAPELRFAEVEAAGQTEMTLTQSGPSLPEGFVAGNPAYFFELQSTATVRGPVRLSLDVSDVSFREASAVRLFVFRGGGWIDVTVGAVAEGVVTGEGVGLGVYAVLEPAPPKEPRTPGS
jgi:hypothetical protein